MEGTQIKDIIKTESEKAGLTNHEAITLITQRTIDALRSAEKRTIAHDESLDELAEILTTHIEYVRKIVKAQIARLG